MRFLDLSAPPAPCLRYPPDRMIRPEPSTERVLVLIPKLFPTHRPYHRSTDAARHGYNKTVVEPHQMRRPRPYDFADDVVVAVKHPVFARNGASDSAKEFVALDGAPTRLPVKFVELNERKPQSGGNIPRQGRFSRSGCTDDGNS